MGNSTWVHCTSLDVFDLFAKRFKCEPINELSVFKLTVPLVYLGKSILGIVECIETTNN